MRWVLFTVSLLVMIPLAHSSCPKTVNGINLTELEKALKTTGIEMGMHGVAARYKLFVGTYRQPKSFFRYVDFSVLSRDRSVIEKMQKLRRHDRVWVRGEFLETESCFPHVVVNEMKVVKRFETKPKLPPFKHRTNVYELEKVEQFTGKVHGVSYEQNVLVLEYKDIVVPVFVPKSHQNLIQKIYRNDVVKVSVFTRIEPERPIHVELDVDQEVVLERLYSMVENHGKKIKITGELALFPKSPQIKFDIFALKSKGKIGFERNFTLVNFKSMEVFEKLRKHLDQIWKSKVSAAKVGRNFWYNPKIKLEVEGTLNVISPSQANPQILIDNIDAIRVIE